MTTTKEPASTATGKLSLADVLAVFTRGATDSLRFTAYDGSSAGAEDAVLGMDLLTPRGTTYLATAPGELGLARAYVAGDIGARGVHPGDPYDVLKLLAEKVEFTRPSPRLMASIIRAVGIEHLLPAAPPPQEMLPRAVSSRGPLSETAPGTIAPHAIPIAAVIGEESEVPPHVSQPSPPPFSLQYLPQT